MPASVMWRDSVGECDSLAGPGRAALGRVGLGQAEVQHLHLAVGRDLHVRGLQVAMDDAVLVGLLERLRDLLRDGERFVEWDRAALQPVREVLALDEFHREEVDARGVVERGALEAVDVGDVRVIERREQLGLALEARQALGVRRERGRQHLDRHVAVELRVGGAIHLAHPARAERRDDLVWP